MVTDCLKHGVRTLLADSGDRFARDRVVQDLGNQGLAESPIEVICFDYVTQYTNPGSTGPLARQMLGGHELVAAQARERLSHGRRRALASAAASPESRRSHNDAPHRGGPLALLKHDPELVSARRVYAKLHNFAKKSQTQ